MPTSETDVASLQIRRMSGEATEPEIPVDVGGVEDTWEVETAEEPGESEDGHWSPDSSSA